MPAGDAPPPGMRPPMARPQGPPPNFARRPSGPPPFVGLFHSHVLFYLLSLLFFTTLISAAFCWRILTFCTGCKVGLTTHGSCAVNGSRFLCQCMQMEEPLVSCSSAHLLHLITSVSPEIWTSVHLHRSM